MDRVFLEKLPEWLDWGLAQGQTPPSSSPGRDAPPLLPPRVPFSHFFLSYRSEWLRRALAVGEDSGRALLVQLWDTPQEHEDKGLALQGGGWGKTRVRRKVDLMMRTLSAR